MKTESERVIRMNDYKLYPLADALTEADIDFAECATCIEDDIYLTEISIYLTRHRALSANTELDKLMDSPVRRFVNG